MEEKKHCCCAGGSEAEDNAAVLPNECCTERKKIRDPEELKKLVNRLNRVEGQIRGIRKMLEDNVYCPDILTQTAAVTAALDAFSRELLSEHIRTCVRNDILQGHDETIDELLNTLRKMMH